MAGSSRLQFITLIYATRMYSKCIKMIQALIVQYKVNKCPIEVSEIYLLYTLYAISINISILQQDCLHSHTQTSLTFILC